MATFSELIAGNQAVLVDFYADWCGPCKMMAPILKELKAELGDKLTVIKVDVDKNPGAAVKFGVQGVPTLILFKNNQQLWRQSGVVQKNQLARIVQNHL